VSLFLVSFLSFLLVVEARDLRAADPGGYSDPYVKVKLDGKKEKSRVVTKTLNP
jgi:Ca2+-dependent lipid-binding protein